MYKKVNRNKGRVFIIGDLHGKFKDLIALLKANEFNEDEDIVVSVGDIIDRGEDNLECLMLLDKSWFHSVKGNHEVLAYGSFIGLKRYERTWLGNGGSWYTELSDDKKLVAEQYIRYAFLNLPKVIELKVGNKLFVIAHAVYPYDVYEYGKEIKDDKVYWYRDEARQARFAPETIKSLVGADYAVYGHNVFDEVTQAANKFFIDTGSGYPGGKLSAMIIDSKTGNFKFT